MFLRTVFRSPFGAITARPSYALKAFTTSAVVAAKPLPPRKTIDENDLQETFIRGWGPGGQKIVCTPSRHNSRKYQLIPLHVQNKTSSTVQLRHLPTGLVIKCQTTRSRIQNRKIARRLLADKLDLIENGSESRIALREEKLRRKKSSKRNKALKKFRKLFGQDDEGEEEVEEVDTEDVDTEEVNSEEAGQEKEKEELAEGKKM